ncbi:IS4 family transposase, partial [Pelagibius sp.]|uniref:IS4 family transposase n=1 Tax=Pelagibius sp. TaxID=1931238 RepID=UPI0026169486
MLATAGARTAGRVQGLHVLAIQDTSDVRVASNGSGIVIHPTIAVEASSGALLGLVHAELLSRPGGGKPRASGRAFTAKQSSRWVRGATQAAQLKDQGAATVTVIADREADFYEDFALRPDGVEVLIRVAQDRNLADGTKLLESLEGLPEAGRMIVTLPAVPGRRARDATVALRSRSVEICQPVGRNRPRTERERLPASVSLTLVEAREIDPPAGQPPAHWRLLTTHRVDDVEDVRRIVEYYRRRWTIEQLFRTLKTKGFDVEALRIAEGPFEKLVVASLIAAVTVMQLVGDRDGSIGRPATDALEPEDQPVLEAVSDSLEGKTDRQKNPHPKGSLAFASWVFARLGGWTGYYGKPGPIVILNGMTQFHAIK